MSEEGVRHLSRDMWCVAWVLTRTRRSLWKRYLCESFPLHQILFRLKHRQSVVGISRRWNYSPKDVRLRYRDESRLYAGCEQSFGKGWKREIASNLFLFRHRQNAITGSERRTFFILPSKIGIWMRSPLSQTKVSFWNRSSCVGSIQILRSCWKFSKLEIASEAWWNDSSHKFAGRLIATSSVLALVQFYWTIRSADPLLCVTYSGKVLISIPLPLQYILSSFGMFSRELSHLIFEGGWKGMTTLIWR